MTATNASCKQSLSIIKPSESVDLRNHNQESIKPLHDTPQTLYKSFPFSFL